MTPEANFVWQQGLKHAPSKSCAYQCPALISCRFCLVRGSGGQ